MIQRVTLDIDTNDKENIDHITGKINLCSWLDRIESRPSNSKGIHVILWCKRECDICRMCYDDQKRFNFDQNRPDYFKNILFSKVIFRGVKP